MNCVETGARFYPPSPRRFMTLMRTGRQPRIEAFECGRGLMVRRCPNCGSTNVRRSSPRSLADVLIFLLLHRPYRCHGCDFRYYGLAFSKRVYDASQNHKP